MNNVVKLKIRKSRTRPGDSRSPDARLIAECVIYAQSVAAWAAGFEADPDGDCVHANKLGADARARAGVALKAIPKMKATTASGLLAKARIVPTIIKDAAGSLDEREEDYMASFVADVTDYLAAQGAPGEASGDLD